MKRFFRFVSLATFVLFVSASVVFAQQQCTDLIDNDADGKADRAGVTEKNLPPDPECKPDTALCEDGTTTCVRNPAATGGTGVNNPAATGGTQQITNLPTEFPLLVKLDNPLGVDKIEDAIAVFMDTVVKIAIPFIVVFFIWSGLSFILAQGNPEKLKKAKAMFWNTVIGTLLILGAWAITDAIVGTINSIAS